MPLFEFVKLNIEAWADGCALVESAKEVDDNLARAVVINDFEFADVVSLHHNAEEFDDDL